MRELSPYQAQPTENDEEDDISAIEEIWEQDIMVKQERKPNKIKANLDTTAAPIGGWAKHDILLAGHNTSDNSLQGAQLVEVQKEIGVPTDKAILPPSDGLAIKSTLKAIQDKELKKENLPDDHMTAETSDTSAVPVVDRPTKELSQLSYIPDDSPITTSSDIQNKASDWNLKVYFPDDKAAAKSKKDSAKQLPKKESECQRAETFSKETDIPDDGSKGCGSEHSIPQSALWMSELYYVIFPDDDKDEDILTKHRWPKNTVDMIKGTCKAIKDKRNEIAHDKSKTLMVHAHLQESFVLELQERNFIISEQDKSNLKQLFNFLKNCKLTKY